MTTPPLSAAARTFIPPRLRVNLTEENQSLINSLRSATSTPQETDTCMNSLLSLMTTTENSGEAQFIEVISELDDAGLRKMAWLLTWKSRYFLDVARNKNGSYRLQKLLGRSDSVDTYFFAAFFRGFLDLMMDKEASWVVTQGLRVFKQPMKMAMFPHIIEHMEKLACDRYGCVAFNGCVTELDDPFIRSSFLEAVERKAVSLSYHPYGNFVVQRVLKLNDLRCTRNIAINLRGRCVELSFSRYGSYVVEKLLYTSDSMVVVVEELLECEGDRLLRLARSQFGNFVVYRALGVAQEERDDLFWDLVNKLRPVRDRLGESYSRNIAAFLDSIP